MAEKHIIGNDKENTASADAHVAYGQIQRLCRRLHQHRDGPGKPHQYNTQAHRDQRKNKNGSSQDRSNLLRPFFAQIPCDQDRDAHGKLRHNKCDQIQDLAPRGDSRKPRCGPEPPYNQQIHCTIGGL